MSDTPTVGVVSQARMTSTRLPGKVLRFVGGDTLLEHHLNRLTRAGLTPYLPTTTNPADDPLVELAARLAVPVHRGSEDDVLDRYAGAVKRFALDVVVRVTSDCPLIDGDLVAEGIREFLADGRESLYLSNTLERTYPRGMDFEIFSASALLNAAAHATDPADREHVTPYLWRRRSDQTIILQHRGARDDSGFRLTVDTEDDLALVTRLIEQHGGAYLSSAELADIMRAEPDLALINRHVEQKQVDA